MGLWGRQPSIELLPQDYARAQALGAACQVGPTIGQILLHRGYSEPARASAFLEPTLRDLTAPESMADRVVAGQRLASAVTKGERIVVFGDYDVDGTTAAVVLGDILEALGAQVSVLCANRFDGGYGLSHQALERCLEGGPGVIVTCDCGSSDHERIAQAQRRGVDVVVVDHHLVPKEPLPAVAFLNPHRPDCAFPYKGYASAGLALVLGAAVRAELGVELDVRQWLDLVALGTVADVAPLDGDNRRLVRAGLRLITSSRARPGVSALRSFAKICTDGPVSAIDIAFRLAPRINAAGRLGRSEVALELLRARTMESAVQAAHRLEQLNDERKELTHQMITEATAQVEDIYGNEPSSGVVVASRTWHRGVVGVAAARLAEHYGVPAVVVAVDRAIGHGSGRSVPGFDLHAAIGQSADSLEAWGGHRAAIGLTLREGQIETFRAAFSDATRNAARPPSPIRVDVSLDEAFAPPAVEEMAKLEPLGEGNPSPRFQAHATVKEAQAVGNGDHLALLIEVAGYPLRAFAPKLGHRATELDSNVNLVGELQPDHFRGGQELQFLVQALW